MPNLAMQMQLSVEEVMSQSRRTEFESHNERQNEGIMLKIICAVCLCLFALPAVCESQAKYEVATILRVKQCDDANPAHESSLQAADYEITARVGSTIYVVLYTDTLGTGVVQYAGGQQLLVHVGKTTITYNDILGRSQEVQIVSQKPVTTKQP